MKTSLPQLHGNPRVWRALGHPIRHQVLEHLRTVGPASSTTVARALGLNTGTTSYHLRVLAEAGLVAEDPDLQRGKQRWWRPVAIDIRESPLAGGDHEACAPSDARRAEQISADIDLLTRLLATGRQRAPWAGVCRSTEYFTEAGLRALVDDYTALVDRHRSDGQAGGAQRVAVRLFFLGHEATSEGRD